MSSFKNLGTVDSDFREIETGKKRFPRKLLWAIIGAIFGVVVVAAVIAVVFLVVLKKDDNDDSVILPTRDYIPLITFKFKQDVDENSDFSKFVEDTEDVTIPHTWNAIDGQSGADYARVPCSYQTEINLSDKYSDKNVYADFFGANLKTTVYVNGEKVGRHIGGYARFRFDITKYVTFGGTNLLTVVVDNRNNKEYYPAGGDFTLFGGIYRDANIIITNKTSFSMNDYGSDPFYIKPSVDLLTKEGSIELNATVDGNIDEAQVRYTIFDSEKKNIFEGTADAEQGFKVTTTLKDVHLWNGQSDPYLYSAVAELLINDEIVDRLESTFGFRNIQVNDTGFYLNGIKVPLRGVARHQDRLDKGCAISNADTEEDFELIIEMGANAVRLAHYQQNSSVYDICDRKGIIILTAIPFVSKYVHTDEADNNLKDQLREMIKQNFNHPSVAFWGIMNEISGSGESEDMYKFVNELDELSKSLDPTRGTYGANVFFTLPESTLNSFTTVIGYNLYGGWYLGTPDFNGFFIDQYLNIENHKPLSLTEYGCEGNVNYHSDNPTVFDYTEEYQLLAHIGDYRVIQSKDLWGSFIWNMFDFAAATRDEGGVKGRNNKGMMTFDRKTRKDVFYFYKAQWNKNDLFVHICSKRFIDRATDDINVTIITNKLDSNITIKQNGHEVNTILNNKEIVNTVQIFLEQEGNNTIEVEVSNGDTPLTDSAIFNKVDKPNTDYIVPNDTRPYEKYPHPDGYYSVFNRISEIHGVKEPWDVFVNTIPEIYRKVIEPLAPYILENKILEALNQYAVLGIDIDGCNAKLNGIPIQNKSKIN